MHKNIVFTGNQFLFIVFCPLWFIMLYYCQIDIFKRQRICYPKLIGWYGDNSRWITETLNTGSTS